MRSPLSFAALAGLLVFVAIAGAMSVGATDGMDRLLLLAFRPAGHPDELSGGPVMIRAMVLLTDLGGTVVLTLFAVAAGAWLLAFRRWDLTLYLALTMLLGTLVRGVLKAGFARSRPDSVLHQVSVDTFSFPSGHAMMSTIAYLTLAGIALRLGAGRWRPAVIAGAVLLPVAIGISRIYLGVHWPSDVIAGWSAGAAWAAVCALGYEAWRKRVA